MIKFVSVKGVRIIRIVHQGLEDIGLPVLARPPVLPGQARTQDLVRWGTRLYTYSAIVHVRTILAGLALVADHENVPAANLLSRNLFEWTAHACYMNAKLSDCYRRSDWEQAWEILTPVATGNMWAKKYGSKYLPPSSAPLPAAPDSVRIGQAVSEYEKYQLQEHGWEEAKDTYSLLSELSHPNSACMQQYCTYGNGGTVTVGYVREATRPDSPLPFVNMCLIDLLLFVDSLLQMAADAELRARVGPLFTELKKEWLRQRMSGESRGG